MAEAVGAVLSEQVTAMSSRPSSTATLVEVLELLRAEADLATKWRLAAAMVTVAAAGALSAAAPLALKGLVDAVADAPAVATRPPLEALVGSGSAYLLALCGVRFLMEIRPLFAGNAEQQLLGRMSFCFFGHLLRLPLAFHLRSSASALVQTVQQATTGIQLLLISVVNSLVPVIVEISMVLIVLTHLGQPILALSFLVTAIAYLWVFSAGAGRLKQSAREVVNANLKLHAVLGDSLLNCEAIKCFGAERAAGARLADATRELRHRWSSLYLHRAYMGVGAAAVFGLSIAASLLISGQAAIEGELSVGGFVLANAYMLQIVRPLEMLGTATRDVLQAIEWIRPQLDILKRPVEAGGHLPSETTISPPTRGAPAVSFRNVRFGYGNGSTALDGIDLDIAAGTTVAIVGTSGSGKSSLIRLILKLYEPQEGQILLDQTPIASLPACAVRSITGLVPQDTVLLNDTIAANIAIGDPEPSLAAIHYAARLAQLHDLVASLPDGYDTIVGERGSKLSGGERQRVAIARAIFRSPCLYLLDEATSMLDGATEASVLRNLREASAGCTTIIVAHRLSSVVHADEIVVLDRGRIAERGAHAELISRDGSYARLWQAQRPPQPGLA